MSFEVYITVGAVVAGLYFILPFSVSFLRIGTSIMMGIIWPIAALMVIWSLLVMIFVPIYLIIQEIFNLRNNKKYNKNDEVLESQIDKDEEVLKSQIDKDEVLEKSKRQANLHIKTTD
ncbi:MAG: hypothetical protein ACQERD_08285 [Campylobacterota bacterium]